MAHENVGTALVVPDQYGRRSFIVDLITRLIKEKPLATVGGVLVLLLFLIAIFADFLAPYGMNETHTADALLPPGNKYVLGTDNLGRDLLSRIILGARVSMMVGLAGSLILALTSVVIGLTSGYFGGKFDLMVQRFVDAFMCFPGIFVILSVMSIVGPGMLQIILVLGLSGGIDGSRVIRAAVISIKENMYIQAAEAVGCRRTTILTRHILPNILAPIIVMISVSMGGIVLREATISFLGFGVPPPEPSWGGMLSGAGRTYMLRSPWLALWPGLALAITIYGINMLGDGLRDLLDPRLRGGLGRYGRSKIGIEASAAKSGG